MNLRYECKACSRMTALQIEQAAALFSQNYGMWSSSVPKPRVPGRSIKMSADFLKKSIVDKTDRYVSLAYDGERLVGHAFFMKRRSDQGHMVTWILQLVVAKEYRGNHIGTKLMHSIWGMSDSWAWGLYTANPYTIKALEDATMRRVQIKQIDRNIEELKSVAYDLLEDMQWIESYEKGIVNTCFHVDHSDSAQKIDRIFPSKGFNLPRNLPEGSEWFAFVFNSQNPSVTHDQMEALLSFSDDITRNDYMQMKMDTHGWASHEEDEMDFILSITDSPKSLLDLGCGKGRHCYLAAQRGIYTVGVDYINLHEADHGGSIPNLVLIDGDARNIRLKYRFDTAIALYDVIGSSPIETENQKILLNAYRHLKRHGKLVISVMNMSITRKNCSKYSHIVNGIRNNIKKLLRMKSSNTMQKNGDVFNGSYILLDEETGICYRKEQFFSENELPIQYIVVDRRYTIDGIRRLVASAGFVIEKCYCVKSGRFDQQLRKDDPNAKEIIVIARKANKLYQLLHRYDHQGCWREPRTTRKGFFTSRTAIVTNRNSVRMRYNHKSTRSH